MEKNENADTSKTQRELLDERFIHPETPFEEIANQIAHTPVVANKEV